MEYETIRVERIGDVLKIVLNRPERLNACPQNMALELYVHQKIAALVMI